ncbi:MAG: acyl-CoA transferase [Rhodospirillaceae bacterium]|nr:acyl-CoA transferase [Rhodospirillaceae bacterium]
MPLLTHILTALDSAGPAAADRSFAVTGDGDLESWFGVTDLAVAAIGAAGLALARFAADPGSPPAGVAVDRRLASLWFRWSLHPLGWSLPSVWDPLAGDYRTSDGWIRLHTNAPHHRAAALSVLGDAADRKDLEPTVARWEGDTLEAEIVEASGCAAVMRGLEAWRSHPQGAAVAAEPLVAWTEHLAVEPQVRPQDRAQPLGGIRVLDLTRVLAGPVAGRFLAAWGADVLRIDPPDWDEPAVVPEVTLGKRCAGLNLKNAEDRRTFDALVREADVLLHGYRPGALAALGYDSAALRALNPRLTDVSLNAYGWTGPWAGRRGFDSLVQMSSGIADHAMTRAGADRPVPLPVQALDHATGYLMAAAVLHALDRGRTSGKVLSARLSLARTACLLATTGRDEPYPGLAPQTPDDLDPAIEETAWGPAHRVRFPLQIDGMAVHWRYPAGNLRSAAAQWASAG